MYSRTDAWNLVGCWRQCTLPGGHRAPGRMMAPTSNRRGRVAPNRQRRPAPLWCHPSGQGHRNPVQPPCDPHVVGEFLGDEPAEELDVVALDVDRGQTATGSATGRRGTALRGKGPSPGITPPAEAIRNGATAPAWGAREARAPHWRGIAPAAYVARMPYSRRS